MAALAFASPAAAAPAWSEPEAITTGPAQAALVAMDARGNVLLAWADYNQGRPLSAYRWWRPGEGWGEVQRIRRSDGGIVALAITPHGQATVIVSEISNEPVPLRIAAATAQPGEAIGEFETITEDAYAASSVRFGLDDAGGAIVAWQKWADPYSSDPRAVQAATRKPGGGFGEPQHLGNHSNGPVGASINAAGAAAVAVLDNITLDVAYRAPGGSFGPAEHTGLHGSDVRLALAADGGVAVTSGTGFLNAGPESRARYALRSPLGDWTEPRGLDAEGLVSGLFFDPAGALTFLIDRRPDSGDDHQSRVATLRPDGTLTQEALDPGFTRGGPVGAMDLRGDILAAWERPRGEGRATHVVVRERTFGSATFGSETVLGESFRGGVVTALNDLGQAVVVWTEGPSGDVGFGGGLRAVVRDDPALRAVPAPPDLDIYADPLAELDGDGDLRATLRCDVSCKVSPKGIVFPGGEVKPIAGTGKSQRIKAGRRTKVKLDFGTAGAKAVRSALASGRKPAISVWVSARGKSPRPLVASRRFKIRRP
jgi:hypothetical protein